MKKLIKQIAELTDQNHHAEAVLILAQYLKDDISIKELERIELDHLEHGHMTNQSFLARSDVLAKLLEDAEKALALEDYQSLNSAY